MTMSGKDTADDATADALVEILHFYDAAGVDCVLADQPIDRFAETQAAKARKPEPTAAPERQSVGPAGSAGRTPPPPAATGGGAQTRIPNEAAVENARQTAHTAETIDALREALAGFRECNLRSGARNTVFADGNPEAEVMFIGEAPGRDEDRQGLPFVGRAGQLLDKMLHAIGLDRTSSYITNIIPWRPPGNRTPTPLEIALCLPFIERHVALVNPKIVVLMGNVSTKSLLGTSRGILSIRGTWSSYHPNNDTSIPAMPTLHPAYLLRNPAHKRLSWQDFLNIRARLDTAGPGEQA